MPNQTATRPPLYYALATQDRTANVVIFGDITSWPWLESDVSAYQLWTQLASLDVDEIHVHLNSYGGEVAEGLAIYNTLRTHKAKVITYVDGLCCSIASVIAMAGDQRIVYPTSCMLIHPAWSSVTGNAAQLRAEADNLDTITGRSVEAYAGRMPEGKTREELLALMAEERFLTPEECLEWGFATEIRPLYDQSSAPQQSARRLVYARLHTQAATPPPAPQRKPPTQSQLALQRMLGSLEVYLKE